MEHMGNSKGFKSIENKLEKLFDLVIPPQRDPIFVNLTESYGTEVNGGNKVIELAIQPDTHELFYVEENTDFDFDF